VGSELRWDFGATPGHYWVLLLAVSPATMYIHGLPVLSDAFVARIGILDTTGLGQLSVVVPASLLGLSFRSQMVAGPGVLLSSTNIVTTTVTN
jgi:hypothetical protein